MTGDQSVAQRVLVTGHVQGVFFRQSTTEVATAAGLKGWVRNLPDGRVEAWLQGQQAAVARVVDWIRAGGPPAARVEHVQATAVTPDTTMAGFAVGC